MRFLETDCYSQEIPIPLTVNYSVFSIIFPSTTNTVCHVCHSRGHVLLLLFMQCQCRSEFIFKRWHFVLLLIRLFRVIYGKSPTRMLVQYLWWRVNQATSRRIGLRIRDNPSELSSLWNSSYSDMTEMKKKTRRHSTLHLLIEVGSVCHNNKPFEWLLRSIHRKIIIWI